MESSTLKIFNEDGNLITSRIQGDLIQELRRSDPLPIKTYALQEEI